eukprot:GHVT01019395.1.p2 GENE.GHVT01019395.1~~GHVT01019395.1.p2  ORF type:complete len:116 (+),score=16.95 GHVT01019395.1:2384-2731(+)
MPQKNLLTKIQTKCEPFLSAESQSYQKIANRLKPPTRRDNLKGVAGGRVCTTRLDFSQREDEEKEEGKEEWKDGEKRNKKRARSFFISYQLEIGQPPEQIVSKSKNNSSRALLSN